MNITKYRPNFNRNRLIPAIIQSNVSGDVLMQGWMNAEAFNLTMLQGEVWFWSRSRRELWHKGLTSGNILKVKKVFIDCDEDALLVIVEANGPTCHTGNKTCFYREIQRGN